MCMKILKRCLTYEEHLIAPKFHAGCLSGAGKRVESNLLQLRITLRMGTALCLHFHPQGKGLASQSQRLSEADDCYESRRSL